MLNSSKNWRVKPSVLLEDGSLQVITCKWHHGGQDKLTLYAPQSPLGHIFNAEPSDQLASCVRKHRVSKQMKAYQYCTKFQMFRVDSGYDGVSTMNMTTHSNFSSSSKLLSLHEDSYVAGRDDIKLLLRKKIKNVEMSKELAYNFNQNSQHRFSEH